jgi:hypothetical protein
MANKIFVSVNKLIINKIEKKSGSLWNTFLNDFENYELTIQEVANYINEGYAICAQHNGAKESKNFIQTNILFVDVDNGLDIETALAHPFVQKHATIFHTTQSHTEKHNRFRLAFQLERPITDKIEMRHALVGLTRKFNCDKSCVDPCRGFFGSKGSNPEILGGMITNAILDELVDDGAKKSISIQDKDKDKDEDDSITNTSSRSIQSLDDNQQVVHRDGRTVQLTSLPKLTTIYCPKHNDRNPSAFVVISVANEHGVHCRTCATTFWPKGRKRLPYEFESFEKYILTDMYSEKKSGNSQYEKCSEYEAITSRIKNKVILNERYLPKSISLHEGITFMKSPKGSGKTEWLAEIVKYCRSANQSILLIGHRQSLIQGISKRLDLTCYFYVEGGQVKNDTPDSYYAICADSVHKLLNPVLKKYDVVIIDESEQVLSHLIGSTVKDKRRITYEIFFFYLKSAKSVVFADADLDLITVATATDVMPKKSDIHVYLNTYKSTQLELQSFADESHLLHDLLTSIEGGGRYYVSTNSKRKAKTLAVAISSKFNNQKKVLLVSSETTTEHEVNNLLSDIASEILKYDVVIATPTLGTGVDISFPKKASLIDGVYGFYMSRINTHFDIDQQLARVRHPKFVKVYVSPENFYFETDINVICYEAECNSHLNDMLNGYLDNGVPIIEKKYLNLYARTNAMSRASKNRLKANFLKYKKQQGWSIEEVEKPSKEELKNMRLYMKDCKDVVDLSRCVSIVDAKEIDEETYKRLQKEEKAGKISIDDELSMRKREIQEFYKQEVSHDLVVLDDNGEYRNQLRLLEIYLTPLANLQARGRIELNEGIYSSDKKNLTLKKAILYELLFSAGIAKDKVPFDLKARINKKMLKNFESVCRSKASQIQELFGINAVPKDLSSKPTITLNKVLNVIGLKLVQCDRKRVNGKSTNFYKIDELSHSWAIDIIERKVEGYKSYTWKLNKDRKKSLFSVLWRKADVMMEEELEKFDVSPLMNRTEEQLNKWCVNDFNARAELAEAVDRAIHKKPKKDFIGY